MLHLEVKEVVKRSAKEVKSVARRHRISFSKYSSVAMAQGYRENPFAAFCGEMRHAITQALVAFWKEYYAPNRQTFRTTFPSMNPDDFEHLDSLVHRSIDWADRKHPKLNSANIATNIRPFLEFEEEYGEQELDQGESFLFAPSAMKSLTYDTDPSSLVGESRNTATILTHDDDIKKGKLGIEQDLRSIAKIEAKYPFS